MTAPTRREQIGQAIFGSFDGMTTVVGLIVCMLGASTHTILAAVLGVAVASMLGMGVGSYMEDSNVPLAVVMAVATAAGTILPALPVLLLPRTAGVIVGLAVVAVLTYVIGRERGRMGQSIGLVVVVLLATMLISVATGAGG